jgi:magnesium and cobalt transporter
VTIEDVLEQIVGDIEDEYDFDELGDSIRLDQSGRYRVKATTEIEDFNHAFETEFSDEEADTIGGLVIRQLGRLPKRGETIELDGLRIQVMRADSRRVYTLLVERIAQTGAVTADGD